MSRLLILLIIIIQLPSMVRAQDWIKIYGQGQNAVGRYIIEDYDMGFVFLGMIKNYKYLWLFKADVNGNLVWEKRIGNSLNDIGSSNVEKTNDGGYIICGSWTLQSSSWDAFIMKLNACAEIEWCKVLITPNNYDMGLRVKPTSNGDYVMLGGYFVTNPPSNVSLFKFNSSGDLIWHQFYPMVDPINDDQPFDLAIDNDGYVISSSRFYPDPGTTTPGIARHFVIKTDSSGNKTWDLVYGGNEYYYGWAGPIKISTTGCYYEAGNHFSYNELGNPAFIKVLHNGESSYNKDLTTGMIWGGLSSIDFLEDSLLVMMGRWYTDLDSAYDGFFKSDTLGNVLKRSEVLTLTNSYESTTKTKDNKFVSVANDATGGSWKIYAIKVNSDLEYDSIYTQPMVYDSLCPNTIISDTINPDCDNVYVGVEEPFDHPESTKMDVFPNPGHDIISIELPKYLVVENHSGTIPSTTVYHYWKSATLEILDLNGNLVFSMEIPKSTTYFQVDVSDWNRGMYLFRLLYNGHKIDTKKILVVH